jgi:hypothetical protein
LGCLSGNAPNVMRPVTVASSHPSAYCRPEVEEPGDCSAALQADDRFFAAALPDDRWAAAPDDHCVPQVQLRGSAAEDSAQAGYSASADSSRADCSEQVAPVPGGSAVRTQDDHSAQEVRTADYSAQAGSVADDSAARCLLAFLPDGYQADSQPVA